MPLAAVGLLLAMLAVYFQRGLVPGDAFTYLAAGERLNAGHSLYALSPGDRPVDLNPPYWTVPLLSPPPIAVVWRPLAALPYELGVYVWWVAAIASIALGIALLARRRPATTGLAVIALLVPLTYEIGVGNVNAFLLLGLVVTWIFLVRGQDAAAGGLVAVMTAVKLTPLILVWLLLTQRRIRGVGSFLVTGAVVLAVSLAGAGLQAHLDYLGIMRYTTSTGTSALSLAGLGRAIGLSPSVATTLPEIALAAGLAGIFLLRRRPGAAYALAVVTMVTGSPVVNVNWPTVLLAALAPLAWPSRRPEPDASAGDVAKRGRP